MVNNKDSADYFIFNLPADPNTGLHKVVEIYRNGKPMLITSSKSRSFLFNKQGVTTTFFPNGRHKIVMIYNDNKPVGDALEYYPNGNLYASKIYDIPDSSDYAGKKTASDNRPSLIECRDSTGVVLAEKGNGKWLTFDDAFIKLTAEGTIKNGLEEGEWHGAIGDTGRFVGTYHAGKIISGTGYDKSGRAYPFTELSSMPSYKGGIEAFYNFLAHTIHYPRIDRENNVTGKVFISFFVEKNGTLGDVKIERAPSATLGQEALNAVMRSPAWIPGYQYGMLARIQFTVPVQFSLNWH